MQISMEKFTRDCLEMEATTEQNLDAAYSMVRVYERAAKVIRRTLDVDGAIILDVGQLEATDITKDDGSTVKSFSMSFPISKPDRDLSLASR